MYVVDKKFIFAIQNRMLLKNFPANKKAAYRFPLWCIVNWIGLFHSPQEMLLKFKLEFLVEKPPYLITFVRDVYSKWHAVKPAITFLCNYVNVGYFSFSQKYWKLK